MFLRRLQLYVISSLCLMSVYSLFYIKDNVITIRSELAQVKKQVENEADNIRLLKAELAYLTSPERLQKLNDRYLNLSETKPSQMINDPLTYDNTQVKQIASAKIRNTNIKWRYKKSHSQYLTTASLKKRHN